VPAQFNSDEKEIQQTVSAEFKNNLQLNEIKIQQTLPAILSWTHYERLMRVTKREARDWYMKEAATQMWSYRTLNRNISTQYYERLLLSQVKGGVEEEMKQKTAVF
jgi:hypothetical protein